MPVPETTSAEALIDTYFGGKLLISGRGAAWREVRASTFVQPVQEGRLQIPAISEPVLMWVTSGEAVTEDRETNGPWITSRVKKGSFYLIVGGLLMSADGGS